MANDTDSGAAAESTQAIDAGDMSASHAEGAAAVGQTGAESGGGGGGGLVGASRGCVGCGYDLRGLAIDGKCPECGKPVADSLRGDELRYSSKEYLRSVRSGLSLALNAILLMIVVMVAAMFAPIVTGATGASVDDITTLTTVAMIAVSMMSLVGYWKYTSPDPSKQFNEDPAAARRVIRVTVSVLAATSATQTLLQLLAPAQNPAMLLPQAPGSGGGSALGAAMAVVWLGVVIVGWAAWAVQFISVMRYTRWMASRVPDPWAQRRAKLYAWLLPVIGIVGILAFFLGPLIALVMYWNLLDRIRKHVKSIEAAGEPANVKRMPRVVG